MSGFNNPVTNAKGQLIRSAMVSDNYVAGTSGWTIDKDGNAEFNQLVINAAAAGGQIVIGNGVIEIFDSVGNLIIAEDYNGIRISPNLNDSTQAILNLDPANPSISFTPADNTGQHYSNGMINAGSNPASPYLPYLQMVAPRRSTSFDPQPFLQLVAGDSGANLAGMALSAEEIRFTNLTNPSNVVPLKQNGNRVYTITHEDVFPATANLVLGGAAANIIGCSHTYNNLSPGGLWKATLITDASIGATAGVTTFGNLLVNAVSAGSGSAICRGPSTTSGAGGTVSCQWNGVIPGSGTLAFQATGLFTGSGGSHAFFQPNTRLCVTIEE